MQGHATGIGGERVHLDTHDAAEEEGDKQDRLGLLWEWLLSPLWRSACCGSGLQTHLEGASIEQKEVVDNCPDGSTLHNDTQTGHCLTIMHPIVRNLVQVVRSALRILSSEYMSARRGARRPGPRVEGPAVQ